MVSHRVRGRGEDHDPLGRTLRQELADEGERVCRALLDGSDHGFRDLRPSGLVTFMSRPLAAQPGHV